MTEGLSRKQPGSKGEGEEHSGEDIKAKESITG